MKLYLLLGGLAAGCGFLLADEGMWTFDNPPAKQLQEKYKFTMTQQWLDHVRLSAVRLNDGGSGSFVSPTGLLLTNHHVARGQLQKNSTAEKNYIRDGFYARTQQEEMRSPDLEVNVLMSMENVTPRIEEALKSAKTTDAEVAARKNVIAAIERESTEKTGLRSDVVTLYAGGEYWLYRYKKYTDVRLVFAPEQQIAFYGGDPDNFTFPRYDLDMAIFRVYENDRPIQSTNYLKWNPKGAKDLDLVFVAGHPGSTERLSTVAQLEAQRDVFLPMTLQSLRASIATLKKYSAESEEHARQAGSVIFSLENSLKALSGRYQGLKDPTLLDSKRKDEAKFKAAVLGDKSKKALYGSGWDEVSVAERKQIVRAKELNFRGTSSRLAAIAQQIVRYVAETKKPDGERLPPFRESQLESTRQQMYSPAPIYPDLEIARMTGAMELNVSELGPNDPLLKLILNGKSPKDAVTEMVRGTKLFDPEVRKKLVEGGEAAVEASADPFIVMTRKIEPQRRELIKWLESNVDGPLDRAGEKLGKARFAAFGRTAYPDATFTLRLSYGQMKGYPMNGTIAPSKTTLYGLYDRGTSFDFDGPFALPSRWMEGRDKLDLSTAINFVTTNDIIGGNSGSPVIDRSGTIIGLIFDGNIESLVGDYFFDDTANRAVAVHTAAMTEALRKLYGAGTLVDELMAGAN